MTKFRLTGKKLFLTYAKTEGTRDGLLKFLETKVSIGSYIIAKEKHKDGASHFHCYLQLTKTCDIKNSRYFDWTNDTREETYHPNFEVAKSCSAVQRYCKKDDVSFITNMKFGTSSRARELAKYGEIDDALRLIMEEQPNEILNLERWRKGFEIIARLSVKSVAKRNFKFHKLDGIERWKRSEKVLILHGMSGWGKTQYAKHLFNNPLVVRHIDKLKQFSRYKHDGIIFDDMSFSHWPRESCIHLLDLDEDADINVKCSMVTIPAGTPRVITHQFEPQTLFSAFDKAIRRRHISIKIKRDLRDTGAGLQCYSSDESAGPASEFDFTDSEEEKPTPVTKRKIS